MRPRANGAAAISAVAASPAAKAAQPVSRPTPVPSNVGSTENANPPTPAVANPASRSSSRRWASTVKRMPESTATSAAASTMLVSNTSRSSGSSAVLLSEG
jgi:hypothetical protein